MWTTLSDYLSDYHSAYGLDWWLWATTAQRSLWCNNSLLIWSSLPHVTSYSSMRCIPTARVFLNDGIKPFRSFINEQAGWGLQCETCFGAIISSTLSRFWLHAGCCLQNKNAAVILGEKNWHLYSFHNVCRWAGGIEGPCGASMAVGSVFF